MTKNWLATIAICCCGCAAPSSQPAGSDDAPAPRQGIDDRTYMARLIPAAWKQPGAWYFDFSNSSQESIGRLVLYFSDEPVDSSTCMESHWQNAVVLENSLDFDFGMELVPAYKLDGTHLTVELTSMSCNVHHRLVGYVTNEGASGEFNYLHSLRGQAIGSFVAIPTVER